MGLLDDAIREHLDLKRRSGADPAEIERLEREALGPVRRSFDAADVPSEHGGVGADELSHDLGDERFLEPLAAEQDEGPYEEFERPSEFGAPVEEPGAEPPHAVRDPYAEADFDDYRRGDEPALDEPVKPVRFQGRSLRDRFKRGRGKGGESAGGTEFESFGGQGSLGHEHGPFAHEDDPFAHEEDPFAHEEDPFAHEPDPFAHEPDPFAHEPDPFANEPDPFAAPAAPAAIEPPPPAVRSPHDALGEETMEYQALDPEELEADADFTEGVRRIPRENPPRRDDLAGEPPATQVEPPATHQPPASRDRAAEHESFEGSAAPRYEPERAPESTFEPAPPLEPEPPREPDPQNAPEPHRAPDPHRAGPLGRKPEAQGEPEHAEGEDPLEETPDFLHDTPEHDRLWFEQRPPRDFDFNG